MSNLNIAIDIAVAVCIFFGFVFLLMNFFDFNLMVEISKIYFPYSILIMCCQLLALLKLWNIVKKGVSK